ncbi:hypothetical protein GBA65_08765 [Rubrobacter marinus]|uniref:Squalene cyclase C-terminal domain-containing protein n=1 Tax=Rubrobacter marinus TaxID=2653852 RepID=A0A6G8PWL9_9ACTN|nr:prenyltransferase/squalene oxidase repeat-containing protein [Rubrobacter marinus]QIN78598.1 hypothetical protein GBA65_08765 [Rubrobacter marinus]
MRSSAYLRLAVDELLRAEDSQLMQSTIYDTCWAARLTTEDGGMAYPHLLPWILDRQQADGSWGSRVPYTHDRLLSTLVVVVLLARFGHRRDDQARRIAGQRYIWRHTDKLEQDTYRTIGFELILPNLLEEGRELGLDLPYTQLGHYEDEREKKLSLLPRERLFDTWTTALHSLEAFAGRIDVEGAGKLLQEDGSMAASPSATACFLSQTRDWRERHPRSTTYLEDLLARGGGLPPVSPHDIFMRAWILYYLHYGGLTAEHAGALKPHHEHLMKAWRPEGVGFSSNGFPDSDDTAMTLLALHRAGYEVDGSCLLAYESDRNFASFERERDPSVSANLHVLEASETMPEGDRARVREKILGYLMRARHHGTFWRDKWHASIYYPTSRAMMLLPSYVPDEMEETLRWLLHTQHVNGAWGQHGPTDEETAITLLALLHHHRTVKPLPQEPLSRAASYLAANERPFKNDYHELWIGKTLYAPAFAIRAAVLSALSLYGDTFGEEVF